jgi:hypothetical protein
MNKAKILSLILWLTALHSLVVGIGLIFIPNSLLEFLGFAVGTDRFFLVQGGVFHIAMAFGYAIAAYDLRRFESLIIFTIIVKLLATIFLFTYFFFIKQTFVILSSAISDFLLFCVIIWTYYSYKKNKL